MIAMLFNLAVRLALGIVSLALRLAFALGMLALRLAFAAGMFAGRLLALGLREAWRAHGRAKQAQRSTAPVRRASLPAAPPPAIRRPVAPFVPRRLRPRPRR